MPKGFKQIKPGKFNIKALRKQLEKGMKTVGNGFTKDFKKTVNTWDTDVEFEKDTNFTDEKLVFTCLTNNDIYRFVNDGTKAHQIKPRNASGVLYFSSTFKARSSPGVLTATRGRKPNKKMVVAKIVNNPGIEPRYFDRQLKVKWEAPFFDKMKEAMSDGAKASGHAIN